MYKIANVSCMERLSFGYASSVLLMMQAERLVTFSYFHNDMKLSPKTQPVFLSSLWRETLDILAALYDVTQLTATGFDSESCISTDHEWFFDNILCLLTNAFKYGCGNEVSIKCDVQREQNSSSLDVLIEVQNVIGSSLIDIDDFFKPRIFKDVNSGGHGLGLFTVHQRINALNGSCGVEIIESKYLKVWIKFPAAECQPEIGASSFMTIPTQKVFTPSILLVDDSPLILKVLRSFFKDVNAVIFESRNGLEALKMMDTFNINLVVMDIQMPVMDGIEAVTKIRELNFPICNVPIIGMSANSDPELELKCKLSNFTYFFTKPLIKEKLFKVISELGIELNMKK